MNCKRKKISSYLYTVDLTHEEAVFMLAELRNMHFQKHGGVPGQLKSLFNSLELEVNGPWPAEKKEEESP